MVSLGFESKNNAIFQMLADLDADGNGSIDFPEFLNLMTSKVSGDKNSRADLQRVFMMYDDNKTGYIEFENLKRVAEDLGEKITDEELDEMMRRADIIDNDGKVSEEEFYQIITKVIAE